MTPENYFFLEFAHSLTSLRLLLFSYLNIYHINGMQDSTLVYIVDIMHFSYIQVYKLHIVHSHTDNHFYERRKTLKFMNLIQVYNLFFFATLLCSQTVCVEKYIKGWTGKENLVFILNSHMHYLRFVSL